MGFVPNHLGHLIKYHLINIIWFTHFYGSFIEINHNLWSTIRDLVACRLYREGLCRPFYLGIVIFLTSRTLCETFAAKEDVNKDVSLSSVPDLIRIKWSVEPSRTPFSSLLFYWKNFSVEIEKESNVKFKNKMVKADRENENLLWSVISQKVGV